MSSIPVSRLAIIGILGGAFSGLFGVGGGLVLVPLLLLSGYRERAATGTSLCAIMLIAALAAALQGVHGNVDIGDAALLAVPAIAGVGVGVAVQQRIPERLVSLLFAIVLIAVAAELILR